MCDGTPPPGSLRHLERSTAGLDSSVAFWEWFLTALGYDRYQDWDEGRSWRHGPTYVAVSNAETEGPFDRHAPD